jgi:hypothetical protein
MLLQVNPATPTYKVWGPDLSSPSRLHRTELLEIEPIGNVSQASRSARCFYLTLGNACEQL